MVRVKWFLSDLNACGHVRGEVPARELNGRTGVRVDCKTVAMGSDLPGTDVMVFQRSTKRGMLDFMRTAQRWGVACVYDLDDDLFQVPACIPDARKYFETPEAQEALRGFLREADLVTVSTRELGLRLGAVSERPRMVVENALDFEAWESAGARRMAEDRSGRCVVGWMASRSHQQDAGLVMPALEAVLATRPWVSVNFMGWIGPGEVPAGWKRFGERVLFSPWVPIEDLPERMAGWDVGLAPLEDTSFNRAKSAVKALQYWALGIPVVASWVTPYVGVVDQGTGWVPENVHEEWVTALMEATERDGMKRRARGMAGRARGLERWDVRRRCWDWVEAFEMARGERAKR